MSAKIVVLYKAMAMRHAKLPAEGCSIQRVNVLSGSFVKQVEHHANRHENDTYRHNICQKDQDALRGQYETVTALVDYRYD